MGWNVGRGWPCCASDAADLQEAAGIRRHQRIGPRRQDVRRLALPKFRRWLWRDQIIDARAATADIRLGWLGHLELGYLAKQRARLAGDALAVAQVAGVVIGDPRRNRMAWRAWRLAGQQFRDVAHLRRERLRPFSIGGIVAQQVAVLLQRRATARHIDRDSIHLRRLEGVDQPPGVAQPLGFASRVDAQRAAAALRSWQTT